MRHLLLALLLFGLGPMFAQTSVIFGKVADQDGAALPGAYVSISQQTDEVKAVVTDADGRFRMEEVAAGNYLFRIKYLGFKVYEQEVTLAGKPLYLRTLRLAPAAVDLQEVEVTGQVAPAIQKGDTTEINADAYKTLPDASAEDLIEKMPTVVVEDGKVQAQGEEVKEVLVDGRPFFGNDPMAALRNLPAEVVEKIQIFDQQSDQAQFTGFDDGETSKTINIITRPGMRNGQFGKVFAGYGYDDKYKAGFNGNLFDGDRRISLIGMTNNINEQNFASEDLLGVLGSGGRGRRGGFRGGDGARGGGGGSGGGRGGGGGSASDFLVAQQGGIAQTHALGVNFSDRWGSKLDISASYFFNHSDNEAHEILRREYFENRGSNQIYAENSLSDTRNINHRFNGRLEFQLDSLNSLIMRPRLSWQQNRGQESIFGKTTQGEALLNLTNNLYAADLSGMNFSNNLLFRHRFAKAGRTFSVNVSGGYAPKDAESLLQSENLYYNSTVTSEMLDQQALLDSRNWNIGTNLMYTEPLTENGQLMLNYRSSWRQEESDRETFDFSEDSEAYDLLNEPLSNIFSNDYHTQQLGGGYNFRKGRELILMARASVQWATLANEQSFPAMATFDQRFTNFLPFAMLRYQVSRQTNFRAFYRTRTQLPSIEQLQNVVDNTNPLQLTVGNPQLQQAYEHHVALRYSHTDVEKSNIFFVYLNGSLSQDYIAQSTFLANSDHPIFADVQVEPGAQLTRPTNLDGYWNFRSFVSYGMPWAALKSNINFDLSTRFSRVPGLINDELNYSRTQSYGVGVVVSSNISDRLDFTFSLRPSYNNTQNSLQGGIDNTYYSQQSRLRMGWIFGNGWVMRSQLSHQLFDGLAEDFDQHYWLWNGSIGKKLFKNQRGELSLSVFDVLAQNRSIQRNVTEIYLEDLQTQVLQRYLMLNFIYQFRNFQTGRQAQPQRGREERDGRRFRGF